MFCAEQVALSQHSHAQTHLLELPQGNTPLSTLVAWPAGIVCLLVIGRRRCAGLQDLFGKRVCWKLGIGRWALGVGRWALEI
jgi:hypothetical protein